jgi:hypothetical protein
VEGRGEARREEKRRKRGRRRRDYLRQDTSVDEAERNTMTKLRRKAEKRKERKQNRDTKQHYTKTKASTENVYLQHKLVV